MFASRSGEAKVPPRPTLPKRPPKRAEDEEEAKVKVRFGEKENRPDSSDGDEDEDGGSVIMFAKMGQGARSMLGSFSTPSASPNREREDDRDDHEKDDEKDEGDAGMVGVDLRVMKTYMRDLTMRLSADAGGSEGRGGGGAKAKAKGGGTIRLYHAMNKGHQRLAIQKKNESDTETKKSENENEEEGRKKSEGAENEDENENESDGWAAKRRQLGEAKKGDPVFVWKTLTPRQHNPSALSSDE
jgi:hypothetical protein